MFWGDPGEDLGSFQRGFMRCSEVLLTGVLEEAFHYDNTLLLIS